MGSIPSIASILRAFVSEYVRRIQRFSGATLVVSGGCCSVGATSVPHSPVDFRVYGLAILSFIGVPLSASIRG